MKEVYIELFRKYFSDKLSDSTNLSDENIRLFLFAYLNGKSEKTFSTHETSLLNLIPFLPNYIEELVEFYFNSPSIEDELIKYCIDSENEIFLKHLTFLHVLSISLNRNEHQRLKLRLAEIENDLTEKEISIAITRNQREEQKEKLIALEHESNIAYASYSSANPSDQYIPTNPPNNRKQLLKSAALILIIIIPASLLLFFNQNDKDNISIAEEITKPTDSTSQKSNLLPDDIQNLADIERILNTPSDTKTENLELIYEPRTTMGYASSHSIYVSENVKIIVNSLYNEINNVLNPYIEKQKFTIDSLELENNDSLIFVFHKNLNFAQGYLYKQLQEVNSYHLEMDSLSISLNQPISEIRKLELFELIDYQNHQKVIYILQINTDFYQIQIGTGRLSDPLREENELMKRALYLKD